MNGILFQLKTCRKELAPQFINQIPLADLERTDSEGFTPLHKAIELDLLQTVEHILKRGVSLEKTTKQGLTPLHLAVQINSLNAVQLLLKYGANFRSKTKKGNTPLQLAQTLEHKAIENLLMDHRNLSCISIQASFAQPVFMKSDLQCEIRISNKLVDFVYSMPKNKTKTLRLLDSNAIVLFPKN